MINMELEFKRSTLRQLKYYKKKNPIAYKLIRKKLEGILNNPEDSNYKKVKNIQNTKEQEKEIIESVLEWANCSYIGHI